MFGSSVYVVVEVVEVFMGVGDILVLVYRGIRGNR